MPLTRVATSIAQIIPPLPLRTSINLFITTAPRSRDTSLSPLTRGEYNVLSWIRGEMKHWAVSDLSQVELRQFTALVGARAEYYPPARGRNSSRTIFPFFTV